MIIERFVVVPEYWYVGRKAVKFGALQVTREAAFVQTDALAAGSLEACEAAKRLLQQGPETNLMEQLQAFLQR
jgi:hypothetical protein